MTLHDQIADESRGRIMAWITLALAVSNVPEHLHEGLIRYCATGILPGGFLQAVLCNDLAQAVARADPVSAHGLIPLVQFLAEHTPAIAWGSRDAVLAWTTTPERLEI